MAYLVYCILKDSIVLEEPIIGVMGKEVSFLSSHDLSVAVSNLDSEESMPKVSELLIYGQVVEKLYRMRTVIPMRYGCFLDGLPALHRVLEEKKHQYDTLLQELDGRVEMGIRILLPERVLETPQNLQNIHGGLYLARRRAYYLRQEEISRYNQALLDRCTQAFLELNCRHRSETATRNGSVIVSIYFLISKSMINQFRENFHRFVENEETKTLLSGPWPPYNFATLDSLLDSAMDKDKEKRCL